MIREIHADSNIRQRLMDLGIIEGVEVEMIRRAPFGGPVQIRVLNTMLALRRQEAGTLVVEITEDSHHGGKKRHCRRLGWQS